MTYIHICVHCKAKIAGTPFRRDGRDRYCSKTCAVQGGFIQPLEVKTRREYYLGKQDRKKASALMLGIEK